MTLESSPDALEKCWRRIKERAAIMPDEYRAEFWDNVDHLLMRRVFANRKLELNGGSEEPTDVDFRQDLTLD